MHRTRALVLTHRPEIHPLAWCLGDLPGESAIWQRIGQLAFTSRIAKNRGTEDSSAAFTVKVFTSPGAEIV